MNLDVARAGIVVRLAALLTIAAASGEALAQTTAATTTAMSTGTLAGSGQVGIAVPHRYADVVLEGDEVSGNYTFAPQPADVGNSASLHVIARVGEGDSQRWFALKQGRWTPWQGSTAVLPVAAIRVLGTTETIEVLNRQALFAGEYSIFVGYRTAAGPLHYARAPLAFTVQSENGEGLHRFSSAAAMEAWLKAGLQATTAPNYPHGVRGLITATNVVASPGSSLAGRTSTTNIQEVGVDEADTLKVHGDTLYALKNCDLEACLEVYDLDSSTATSSLVTSYKLGNGQAPDGMYLVDDGISAQRMLVTVAGHDQLGLYAGSRR